MPLIYFSRSSQDLEELFFADIHSQSQDHDRDPDPDLFSPSINEPKSATSSSEFKLQYQNLSNPLKSCLDYCSFITFKYSIDEEKLIHLLLAENLVPQIPGKITEETAETILQDLISLGMIHQEILGSGLEVDDNYMDLCLVQVQEKEFISKAANSPVFSLIYNHGNNNPPDFQGLKIRSLFITRESDQGLSRAYMESICKLETIMVFDFQGMIECLPDGIGNMVNLRYLGLNLSGLDEFPPSSFNLQNLLTLDIRRSRLGNWNEIPGQVLKCKKLRHLLMSHDSENCEISVPEGFGSMEYLHTCDGVYAGNGIAKELGKLTQLSKLGVKRVADDHSDELAIAISKMKNLASLSLEAEGSVFEETLFPELENFVPPPFLRALSLYGGLAEIPSWVLSLENLTNLSLSFSRLTENQLSVLQFIPKLKILTLWNACNAKYISKGFCDAGGFKELERLEIVSDNLVEWSEIVCGAFSSLRVLMFRNCMMLKFLPEGLQNVSSLQELCIFPVYTDIGRRLYGEESYKIKHIRDVSLYELPSSFMG